MLAVDVNGDGKPDVYVTNDTVDNFLYLNRSTPGKIRFEEVGVFAGVARDESGQPNGSMGVDAGDPDGDGKPYIWVTNYEKELHALYKNVCTRDRTLFLYHTPASGIAAIGQSFVGWGTGFVDFDCDGWEDIFVANGHAIRYPTTTTRQQLPVLLHNLGGGKFKDITPRGGDYFKKPHLARGAALGDLNNNGLVDVVVCHLNQPASVLRNIAALNHHWLGIELRRPKYADIVGTRVVVEVGGRNQTRFAKGGGSYASSPDRRLVFGLGSDSKVGKVIVYWPDGSVQEFPELECDCYWRLTQGNRAPAKIGHSKP